MTLQIVQNPAVPDLIDLGRGDPNPLLFPMDALRRAAEERFKQEDASFLQYGTEQGDGYFRLALAQFLTQNYRMPVQFENIFVTNLVPNIFNSCHITMISGDCFQLI